MKPPDPVKKGEWTGEEREGEERECSLMAVGGMGWIPMGLSIHVNDRSTLLRAYDNAKDRVSFVGNGSSMSKQKEQKSKFLQCRSISNTKSYDINALETYFKTFSTCDKHHNYLKTIISRR